ncbi:RNA-directed DNA polymerase, eukaryota, Reverse transcriptase zinc-binding domain protein [Artemisia annua]|uniref:RNA-directed DNA polymerase, eukaryota, Reverse transcriptase zinc-binding domain protein n=1 Tax=Artemisia annua TaxID=35608 RepID=A0A2U1KRR7_ARTAN|nr:RNA-directed DNA polymerase, eukaryota, Reverse transcriptase zinc-binding domain protein [Artemisia annua]
MEFKFSVWNIRGMSNEFKQNEAVKFIRDEKLQYSPLSCRVVFGWNPYYVKVMVVNMTAQSIMCTVELVQSKFKFYCSIVYASNSGSERRILWDDLILYKQAVGNNPWVIMGDFNVTLDISEHSAGGSHNNMDMNEFKEAVNKMEVDDICSSGFHFTWTKSLKNPNCNTLKKLDRILVNEEFINKFQNAYGVFLPYTISDHSPSVLIIKDGMPKKQRSFRFSNFIYDKEGFLETVKKEWDQEIHGCHMYSLCNTRSDSHEHLFFQCSFANKVWEVMVQNASFMNKNHGLLTSCRYIANKQIKNNFGWTVDKLILAASVYFIWQERNRRLFTRDGRNVDSVICCIKDSVKTRLLALKVKKSTKAQRIASKWGLKWSNNEMFEAC